MPSEILTRKRKRNLAETTEKLCVRCSRLDLDAAFARKHKTYLGEKVENLGPVKKWATSSCPFCKFLAEMLPDSFHDKAHGNVTLRSFSSTRTKEMGWKSINTVMLALEYNRSDSTQYFVPQYFVPQSYKSCPHTLTCGLRPSSNVPNLKVIDCKTRKIVSSEDQPYVALSYVWGSTSANNDSENVLSDVPDTIEDSLTVTLKLGFRYLWIDRYCISQTNQTERSEQIARMDAIYQNAEVTIVAAAGEDPTFGLPGVNRRPRQEQPTVKVGEHFLVSALEDPAERISQSKWMERAWTYQEALLSRRRLIFTDEQIYYECGGMYSYEALDLPLHDMHTNNSQGFRAEYRHGQSIGMFPAKTVGATPWQVVERIEAYSQRTLGRESDKLNGIRGILRAFERSSLAIHHFWGVPIISTPAAMDAQPKSKASISGLVAGLCWDVAIPSARRGGFPSWSWTGWTGTIRWAIDEHEWKSLQVNPDISFKLERTDGATVGLDHFLETEVYRLQSAKLSHYIHVSAWTIPIPILRKYQDRYSRSSNQSRWETRIDQEDGSYLLWNFAATTSCDLTKQQCTGICLGLYERHKVGPLMLIVGDIGNGMERVGLGWIDQCDYRWYGPAGELDYDKEEPGLYPPAWNARRPKLQKTWQIIRLG